MKKLDGRIARILKDLKRFEYRDKIKVETLKIKDGHFLSIEEAESSPAPWRTYTRGEFWGTVSSNHWFQTEVEIDERFQGKTIALNIHDGQNGWDAVNPQFVLYVNNQVRQGLDLNHKEVIVSRGSNLNKIKIDLHAFSGLLYADLFFDLEKTEITNRLFVDVVVLDEAVRDLYYNIYVPLQVCEKMDDNDKRKVDTLRILNETINLLDLRKPFSEEFDKSVIAANNHLIENFYEKMTGYEDVIASCIGHTHIDVAWWWTVAQTRQKATCSFSTVLNLMKEYPTYKFMSSQPQLYQFLKEDQPEIFEEVKKRVKEGRWEAEGGMWLEADANLVSGESFVRQFLYGKRFFKEEFDVDNKVLWLPDVFGYSASLPQICKKSGIDYFMTTKISWNKYNKIGMDTFNWKGIDGTEMLTHFITTTNLGATEKDYVTTYNGLLYPEAVIGAWNRYQQKEINNDVLICYGYGDGGGGTTVEMLEIEKRLSKGLPGCPKTVQRSSRDYFEKLEKTVQGNKNLPKWDGELYLEHHRGTYTSMAKVKKYNRKSELTYQDLEFLSSLAMLEGKDYGKESLDKAWKTILLNQFHDILPGTSIKEVYEVNTIEYENILNSAEEKINENLKVLSNNIKVDEKSVVTYNTLSHERTDLVKVELTNNETEYRVFDGEIELPTQIIIENEKKLLTFIATNVPPKGYKSFKIITGSSQPTENLSLDARGMENRFFKISFDDKMQFTSIFDKRENRELLKVGEKGNVLQAFEDKPKGGDTWNIEEYFDEKMWIVDDIQDYKIETGNVRSTLTIKRKFVDSIIIQKVHFYNELDRIDFETYIDWKQSQVLLKVAFPLDIQTSKATYDIQFGNVERPTHKNTSWNIAQFEVCAHKWADLSDRNYGMTLMNDCKYGYDIIDSNMRLTLIKAGVEPHKTADIEEHRFTYSILPHLGDWRDAKVYQKAYELNQPMYSLILDKQDGEKENTYSFINVDKDNIIIETIKKAEDSDHLIIRAFETTGARTTAQIKFTETIESIEECNLMEEFIAKEELINNCLNTVFSAYEIKTFKIKIK